MRLTLRTLLAYMDDVLEPEDREDLRAKIEHSEFAGDLLHRSRDVMRRLRLGAPAVTDLKKGMDANSVAEYLDNTMSPEQVADFERLCLESDVALAEVASCHQILTMVLGEPADVRPEARARMYDIPSHADLLAIQTDDGAPPVVLARDPSPQVAVTRAPAVEVPDYLRQSFFEKHRGKLAVAASLLIAGAIYIFWPPAEPQIPREIARGDIERQMTAPRVDEGETEIEDEGEAPDASAVTGDLAADSATGELDAQPLPSSPIVLTETEDDETPPANIFDDEAIPALPPELERESVTLDQEEPVGPSTAVAGDNEIRLPPAVDARSEESPLSADPPLPTVEPTERPAEAAVTPPLPTPPPLEAASATDETSATTAIVEPPEPVQEHVATYVSRGEMLLRLNDKSEWGRLMPLDRLFDGDQLLALPASRPLVMLQGSNLSVHLQPATRIVLSTGDLPNLGGGPAPAGLNVLYGRVVIFNSQQAGTWAGLRLRLGDAVYPVELDGESTLAIDALRKLPAGVNPLENSGVFVADVFGTTGRVRWQGEATSATVEAPSYWHVAGGTIGPQETLSSEPIWINEDPVLQLDRLALRYVEPAIVPGRPAQASLAELADHRRREVRGLVSRASIHVGEFEPFVKSLNDASQSQLWDDHIAVLQTAMALDPQVAARVREAFANYKGREAGDALFRLLWGYSKDQLENGAIEELIGYLNHESLDFRVLAFNNLHRATGKKLLYSPNDQPQQRERYIRDWRKRLMDGDLEVHAEGTGG